MHKLHPVLIPQYCIYLWNILLIISTGKILSFIYIYIYIGRLRVIQTESAIFPSGVEVFQSVFKCWLPHCSTVQKTAVLHLLSGMGKVGECPENTWSNRCGKPRPSSWWRTTPSFPEDQKWGFRYGGVLQVMTSVSPPCWNTSFPSCGVYTCKK